MRTKVLLSCFFLSILLVSCVKEPEPIKVTGITLNSENLLLYEDETADLMATISPKDADNQTVLWSSSNGSVASVYNGKVTALKAGATTITAKSDDGGFTASCAVTVVSKSIEVNSITLSKTELTLTEGESETLVATVKPDDATEKAVSWSSSDASIATVEDGKVTAVKEGSATITAKAGGKTATCSVKVEKKVIPVERIELDKSEISIEEGQSEILVATVYPEDATDKAVTWSSDNESIATVESDGTVHGISVGETMVHARISDIKASCKVTVKLSQDNTPITFADAKLKERLVAKFDTNGDGELSYGEAAAVTSIDGAVTIKTITSFDEFQYFIGVTDITGCFMEWRNLKSIILPPSINYIGKHTFQNCISLESINIPEGVTIIDQWAFQNCSSLNSIVFPESLITIGPSSFENCSSLKTIKITRNLKNYGRYGYAFNDTFSNPFIGCDGLESITVDPSNSKYDSRNNCNAIIETETNTLYLGCKNSIIPNNISSIYTSAFEGCSFLTDIQIPESVNWLGPGAFKNCSRLTSINIPKGEEEIAPELFAGCSSLTSIVIPDGVSVIQNQVFENCISLKSVIIPDSVNRISIRAFNNCSSLLSVSNLNGVSWIDENAFFGCSSLASILFSESLLEIGKSAFEGCSSLSSVSLPITVNKIGRRAFYGCLKMASIKSLNTTPPSGDNYMFDATSNCPIYVPLESVEAYRIAQYWSRYTDRIQAIL